jgi:hypothetical protein
MILKKTMKQRSTQNIFTQFMLMVIALTFFSLLLTACNEEEPEPESLIRSFIYENQPVTEEDFLRWAGKNLSGFSSRRVYEAIYNEGKSQAKQGHPAATGVLQSLAKAWSRAKGLPYNTETWKDLQKEALDNLEANPTLRGIWPPSN